MIKFFKKANKVTNSVSAAAFMIGAAVLVSRVLGLLRDRILAGLFGAGIELDIYFAAFRIPDLIYSILFGGAIASAFIPVFISRHSQDKKDAWHLARSFFYVALFSIIAVCLVAFIFMDYLTVLIVPGFDPQLQEVVTFMARIMLLSPLFLGISAVFSGILHSFRKFFVYSLAPIFYNIGIIIGALLFTQYLGVIGLAWGVVLGAFMHMAVQVPDTLRSGFKMLPLRDIYHPAIKRIVKLMLPRTFGLAAHQINLWVITAIASTLGAGSLAIFTFANNIQYLPIGIVGISFATAVFPTLSKSIAHKEYKKYLKQLSAVLTNVMYLVIPLSVFLYVFRAQIVRVILGTGQFSWADTRLTAAALGAFAIGVFTYALAPILTRAFYSQENTKTPVIATVIGIMFNVALSVYFIYVLFPNNSDALNYIAQILHVDDLNRTEVIGLPIAFSLGGIATLLLLFNAFFKDRRNREILPEVLKAFMRIMLAGLFAGFVGWLMLYAFEFFVSPINTFMRVLGQLVFAGLISCGIYLFVSYMFSFREFSVFTAKFRRAKIPKETPMQDPDAFSHDE